jgi:opacity protein-like surface antigen
VDPIIGFRLQSELTEKLFFRATGDIGGFGVSSDLTWQAMGGFGYRFTERCSGLLGDRAIGTDYTDGGFAHDVTTHGPVIGLGFRF